MPGSKRPISPHLQIYRWQLHMLLSILHRLTGLFLALGLVLLTWWSVAMASGEEAYKLFQDCVGHPLGVIVVVFVSYSLIFHAINGIRHLVWDWGEGLSPAAARRSGQIAVVLSTALTILLWIVVGMQLGKL